MTAMELLMEVADDFREHGEGRDILIVYTNEAGDVCVKANGSKTQTLGLTRYAEEVAIQELMAARPGDRT